jgi:hypothetical protein
MHGVPHELDLQPLTGSSITSIQIGKYQVNLTFTALHDVGTGDRGHIGLEGPWELRAATGETIDQGGDAEERQSSHLPVLLHRAVVAWRVEPPQSFSLEFEGGYVLTVHDQPGYESFSITMPGRTPLYV